MIRNIILICILILTSFSCKKESPEYVYGSFRFSSGFNAVINGYSDGISSRINIPVINPDSTYQFGFEIGDNRQFTVYGLRSNDTGHVWMQIKDKGNLYTDSVYGYNGIRATVSKIAVQ
jgi:hypothetical protein